MALETQDVFNREVWLDLGNHPTEVLAAQGAVVLGVPWL
jgi:hypothetical protein